MHFGRSDLRIPVRDGAKSSPSVEVNAGEPKRRGNQCASSLAIGPEGLPVLVQFGIKASRTPAVEHLFHRGGVDAELIGKRLEIRSERNDCAHVQVSVGPAVQALSNARCQRVIHSGMTEGALIAGGRPYRRYP
jgi:hypothetical protein